MPVAPSSALFNLSSNRTLAQSPAVDNDYWFAIGLLFVVLIVGALILYSVRRRLFASSDSVSSAPGGGLLEHLDEMKRTGQITKEEYDQTRRTIIEKASRQMRKDEQAGEAMTQDEPGKLS